MKPQSKQSGRERKIKIDGVVHSIDISDGNGILPFSMNGAGGMTVIIDGKRVTHNGFVGFRERCLDGSVNFKHVCKVRNLSNYNYWCIDDKNHDNLSDIHKLGWEDIEKLGDLFRRNVILWGLRYEPIECIENGYRFGRELTFNDFCVTFDDKSLVVYKSSHNGYIAPDYLKLDSGDEGFEQIHRQIVKSIKNYFSL